MVLYFTRPYRSINTFSTLTSSGGGGGQVLLDVFAMVFYFTNTGVRKVVIASFILKSFMYIRHCKRFPIARKTNDLELKLCGRTATWAPDNTPPVYPNARTETFLVDALVQTIGIFGTDRAYRPRDRYRDLWEL